MRAKTKVEQLERRAGAIAPDEDLEIVLIWVDTITGEEEEAGRVTVKAHRHFEGPKLITPDASLA